MTDGRIYKILGVRPSYFELISKGEVQIYHFPTIVEKSSIGDNPRNISRLLEDIREGDYLEFCLDDRVTKGENRTGKDRNESLKRKVLKVDITNKNTTYIYFSKV